MIIKSWQRLIVFIFSLLIILIVFMNNFVSLQELMYYIKYEATKKSELKLSLRLVNPSIKLLACDPSNSLILKADVRDREGRPVNKARVSFSVEASGLKAADIGSMLPSEARTDKNGECIVKYIPPSYSHNLFKEGVPQATLKAEINNGGSASSLSINLTRNPVVLVHGYRAGGYVFENLNEYLSSQGFDCSLFNYDSTNGVVDSSSKLNSFLKETKALCLSKGIQVEKFDLIGHSMGGLVARYYTCSSDYILEHDINKIIFISTPHRGSPWAPIGAKYYSDQGIKDLIPDNALLTRVFPSMLNNGLNNTIQTGSIVGQYDEVVSPESASLEEWNINTEVFFVGETSLNFDNLLKGNFAEGTNHINILSNKKVFEKLQAMLDQQLPYPIQKK